MNIETRPLADIKPYEKNPRDNDAAVDAVAQSIRQFGFRQPIVVDEAGVIVCGHTRWKAAQKLGLEKVPVHQYVAALGDEPTRLADRPITTIGQVPPPAEFVELWQADVSGWKSRHETTDELSMTLAACGRRNFIPTAALDATANTKGKDAHVEGTAKRAGNAPQGS